MYEGNCDGLVNRIKNLELMVTGLCGCIEGDIPLEIMENMSEDFLELCQEEFGAMGSVTGMFRKDGSIMSPNCQDDTDDTQEPAPCPFCACEELIGPLEITNPESVHSRGWLIECQDCGCLLEGFDTDEDVLEAWNTRE